MKMNIMPEFILIWGEIQFMKDSMRVKKDLPHGHFAY